VYIYILYPQFFKHLTDTFLRVLRKLTDEFHERKPPHLGHGKKSRDGVCQHVKLAVNIPFILTALYQPNQRGLVASVILSVSTAE
jgi:hypothetical protein